MDIPVWTPKIEKGKPISVVCAAPRESGKSNLLKNLFDSYFFDNYDFIAVFSETSEDDDFWFDFLGEKNSVIYNSFKSSKVKELEAFQKRYFRRHNVWLNVMIILDDVTGAKNNKELLRIYNMGRHTKISVYWIAQTATQIAPEARNNTDIGIFFKQVTGGANEFMIKHFVGAHMNGLKMTEKLELINNIPRFHSLIVDTQNRDMGKDKLRRYKAPMM